MLRTIFLSIVSVIVIVAQQSFVIGLGFLLYNQEHTIWAILAWLLAIPMIWVNYWTVKYLFKYGFILFITANADTSEIDIPKEKRPYNN